MLLPSTGLTGGKDVNPDEEIKEILDLRVSNVESYVERVIDERYETEEEKLESYKDDDPLVLYEILSKEAVNSDDVVYQVEMEYESGFVYEHNVHLVKVHDDWYINIPDRVLEKDKDFKVIKGYMEIAEEKLEKELKRREILNNHADNFGINSEVLIFKIYPIINRVERFSK